VRRYTPCQIHTGFEEYTSYRPNKHEQFWLIGYGSPRLKGKGVNGYTVTSREVLDEQLEEDLKIFARYVDDLIYMPLNEKKKAAVLSYAQSIGIFQFKHSFLLELINKNAKKSEIIREWSPFTKKNYLSNPGLVDRRRAELDVFLQPDKDVPLLVEHKCKLPSCLLNLAASFNGSPQQVKAIEYLEKELLKADPGGKIIDKFFSMWREPPLCTGSQSAFLESDLKDLETLRYASSLIPVEKELEIQEADRVKAQEDASCF
jgi:GH24 family phage-related lysozyme (muramidase)